MHQSINHVIIKKYKKINFLITFLANSINPESYDQYKSLEKAGGKTNSLFKESCGSYTDGHHWHGQKQNQVPGIRENLEINAWTDNPTSTEEMLPRAIRGVGGGGLSVERRGQPPHFFPNLDVILTLPLAPCMSKLGWGLVLLGRRGLQHSLFLVLQMAFMDAIYHDSGKS